MPGVLSILLGGLIALGVPAVALYGLYRAITEREGIKKVQSRRT